MRESDFREWLENVYLTRSGTHLEKRPRSDAMSRCRRVEEHEGDLDMHYEKDRMRELRDRLTYTSTDKKSGTAPRHNIYIDGDIYTGTASLSNAVNLYKEFREDSEKSKRAV